MRYILTTSIVLCTFCALAQRSSKETLLGFERYRHRGSPRIWNDHPFDSNHIYTFQMQMGNTLRSVHDFRMYKKMIQIAKREKPANIRFVFYTHRSYSYGKSRWSWKNNDNYLVVRAEKIEHFFDGYFEWYSSDRKKLMENGIIVFGKKGRKSRRDADWERANYPRDWHVLKRPKHLKLPLPPLDSIHISPPTDINGDPIRPAVK